MTMYYRHSQQGFTLVEMIVAVALFAVVMLVSVSALLALVTANRKAQALQSVMNNLDVTLDGMARAIRMGTNFHCGSNQPYTLTRDCPSGDTVFAFEPYGKTPTDPPWVYRFHDNRLYKSENNAAEIAITAPEISIDDVKFYVVGTDRGCTVAPCNVVQPKVVIELRGTAPVAQSKTRTSFHIQVTAVQRVLDL